MSSRARSVASLALFSTLVAGGVASSVTRQPPVDPAGPVGPAAGTAAAAASPMRPPALLVRTDPDSPSTPLAVEQARYEVTIDGLSARTRATLVFRNDLDRILDGELVFPLPEDALITGFALDVNGRLVDGVVVEAHEARVAFESETRRRVDPGLVEWVRGNNFRTRVFPIPARGRRTIALEYISDLIVHAETGRALYDLPLRFAAPVDELSLTIDVARGDRPPVIESGFDTVTFTPWRSRYVTALTRRQVRPGDDLRVALPDAPRAAVVVDTNDRGETFFAIDDTAPTGLAGGGDAAGAARQAPPRIGVAWDASFSREGADRERDLRLLGAHLARLRRADVEAVVFRNVAEPPRRFAIVNGDASALVAWLREQPCDGATNLAALRLPQNVSHTLLFTDGLSTIGGRRDERAASPIYALSSDPRADHARLRALAEESGGAYVNLQRHTDADALDRLGRPGLALLAVETDAGEVADVEPAGVQMADEGRVRITGRLLTAEARLTLRYGVTGSDRRAQQTRTVVVRRSAADDGGPGVSAPGAPQNLALIRGSIAAHLWAQQRMAALARDPDANRAALVQLGQRFSIVTPGTSLLVLETLDQYVRHNVTPPASWPEMRAAFRAHQQRDAQLARVKRADKTEQVVAMWRRRVERWARAFPETPWPESVDGPRGAPGRVGAGSIAIPPPAPAPAFADRDRQNRGRVAERRTPAEAGAAAPSMALSGEPTRPASTPARDAAKLRAETSEDAAPAGRILVQPWNPDTPYLRTLEQAGDADRYRRYLAERATYGNGPAFFLDCANVFAQRGQLPLALRILTTVAELRLEDARLMRVLAHRLSQVGELDLAVELFERVHALRPEEPQSYRDLALTLDIRSSARAEAGGAAAPDAVADARRALTLLADVVEREWDGRFPEVEVLALVEANRIATRLERAGADARWPLDARLRRLLDFDVRVVLTWDTDDTDMDLWVVEPSGEKCFYGNAQTRSGGALSRDFTGGYGPEEYSIRRAPGGAYTVKANFFGSRAQSLTGPTTVQATIITDYGRPTEARRSITLRLIAARDVVDIGTVDVKGPTKSSDE